MPTRSASEPPLAVALLHGAVGMIFYEASETWYRIATSIWCVSPRRALEQADEISSSTHSHRKSGRKISCDNAFQSACELLNTNMCEKLKCGSNADHFFTWTGEYANVFDIVQMGST